MSPDEVISHRVARTPLSSALEVCRAAASASRVLDAAIALAVFPALGELTSLEDGVWSHADGSRIRALRYTGSRAAATTLVPQGSWIEAERGGVTVVGPGGSWSAVHDEEPMAICIASLLARLAPESGK